MRDFAAMVRRKIQAGHGQGSGDSYVPFLSRYDASRGSFRFGEPSILCSRNHQLLGKLELGWLHIWAMCPGVVEIREQYPLFPRERTREIATKLNLRHPRYPDNRTDLVLTTDLLVFVRRRHRLFTIACAVKPAEHLRRKPVQRTLAIEREYWRDKADKFLVLTDSMLPRRLSAVLDWLYPALLKPFELPTEAEELAGILRKRSRETELHRACLEADEKFNRDLGHTLEIVRHMVARRKWPVERGRASLFALLGGVDAKGGIPIL